MNKPAAAMVLCPPPLMQLLMKHRPLPLVRMLSTTTCLSCLLMSMVNAITCVCTNAHTQAATDLGKAKVKGKAKGNVVVPFVWKEDIIRPVAPTLFFFGSPLTFSQLTYLTLVSDDFSLAKV